MKPGKKMFSVKWKMYIFITITVLVVALGTAAIAFSTSVAQIDRYYKQSASDNARNFASMVDGDYLAKLKEAAASDEFQELRVRAEAEENEELIEEYLKEHDLWEGYYEIRTKITEYLSNMEEIEYIYIVAHGDKYATHDMYLVDDEENPLYETGYYEEREAELRGKDLENLEEPTISNGDWGWLCSDFKPVYDSNGNCVCIVGCDYSMEEVMAERRSFLVSLIGGAFGFAIVVLIGSMLFIRKVVAEPIKAMTKEMSRFNPYKLKDYETAGVIDLNINSNDEIAELYNGIKAMQTRIIDYLKEKIQVENDLKYKDQRIDKLSMESYKDALTGVGNKAAFIKKSDEMKYRVFKEGEEFAIVMVDLNNLKHVNDNCGHEAGDTYIKGCCHSICEVFKHSPVFRIGGDEFAVILRGPDFEHRASLTEELKKNFEDSFLQEDKEDWYRYSAAVGMAEKTPEDTTIDTVFNRADKAMYEDKTRFKSKYGSVR